MKKFTIFTSILLSVMLCTSLNAVKRKFIDETDKTTENKQPKIAKTNDYENYKIVCNGEDENSENLLEATRDVLEQSEAFKNTLQLDDSKSVIPVSISKKTMEIILSLMKECAQWQNQGFRRYQIIAKLVPIIKNINHESIENFDNFLRAISFLNCRIIRAAFILSQRPSESFSTLEKKCWTEDERWAMKQECKLVFQVIKNELIGERIVLVPDDLAFCGLLSDEIVENWRCLNDYVIGQTQDELQIRANDLADLFICLNLYFPNYSPETIESLDSYFTNHPKELVATINWFLEGKTFEEASALAGLTTQMNIFTVGFGLCSIKKYEEKIDQNDNQSSFLNNFKNVYLDGTSGKPWVGYVLKLLPFFVEQEFPETLMLVDNNFTVFPNELNTFSDGLQVLLVNGNKFTYLPESIGNLLMLEILDVSHNQLTDLPESIEKLVKLSELNIQHNQFVKVPECIQKLLALRTFDVSNNHITELPEWIENLSTLEYLYIGNNLITELPESLENLLMLEEIDISNTHIQTIPAALLEWWEAGDLQIIGMTNEQLQILYNQTFAELEENDDEVH